MTTVDISASAREILAQVFKDDAIKLAVIDRTIKFADVIIDKNKIREYTDEIKKIIAIEQKDDPILIESIEILGCIKNILEDLYSHLESIKKSVLTSSDRDFIKNNIDVIAQVVLVVAFDGVEESGLIDKDILIKILSFVRIAAVLDIDMHVSKFSAFFSKCSCCKKTD